MHQPATPLNKQDAVTSPDDRAEQRKLVRKVVSVAIVASAVLITLYVWGTIERHPRTDDAAARANVVGIVPRVRGQIVKLAAQEVAAEEQKLNQARAQLSQLQTLLAQRPGAVAAVKQAELDLSYCKVTAPFDGRVINLNISGGAYASIGMPVFSLLDTTKWYVVANFREAELRHMAPGSPATVYLVSAPNQRFRGKVQGIGWAVKPEGEIDLPPAGVPYVKRELNWVRVAQRFPVRIEVEHPDRNLFRMGASAVAIIDGPPTR